MIPERFSVDYPERVMRLLDETVALAQALDLTSTHAVVMAMPLLIVPLERLDRRGTMGEARRLPALHQELEGLKTQAFDETPMWSAAEADDWHFGVVAGRNIDSASGWRTETGVHPCTPGDATSARKTPFDDVLLTMRHGMAHGNVVYLDEHGDEIPGRRVTQLAFVAKTRKVNGRWDGRYRVLVVKEAALVSFLRRWADWIGRFGDTGTLRLAA